MAIGLVGRKLGMTRIFTPEGLSIPVSVVEILPNRVTQVKTVETDGYPAVQITTGSRKAHRVTKALAGHYAKANQEAGRGMWEFTWEGSELDIQVGGEIPLDLFQPGQLVDVQGVTKGRGYAGTVRRYNFRTQDATHGNSLSHRVPGSIGQNQSPGRVFKGKKMTGHLGADNRTTQNLEVIRVDSEKQVILIKGAIPGAPGGDVIIRPAVKRTVQVAQKA